MSVVKETNGLMTIPSNVDTLTAGEYSYVPSDVSKGHLTLALKKAGVTLGEKKLTMQALSPAQPILKLAIGTQGAASDDSATKLSWNVTDGEASRRASSARSSLLRTRFARCIREKRSSCMARFRRSTSTRCAGGTKSSSPDSFRSTRVGTLSRQRDSAPARSPS